MNNYRINKVYIENFKLISGHILIDQFQENDFIVFDGPNGFGKTTVFDAIEIALTGIVHRVFNNDIVPGGQGADDNVYLNDQTRPMKIVIEFSNGSDSKKVLLVYGESSSNMGRSQLKANNSNYFKRYELESFDQYDTEINNLNLLSQSDINSWFNDVDIERYYKLYHYIQQEETTFFLKMKENKRMDQLGTLFNTIIEEGHQQKIKARIDEIKSETDKLNTIVVSKRKELGELDISIQNSEEQETTYQDVFAELNYNPVWNQEKLTGLHRINDDGETIRNVFKAEVNLLINFIENFQNNHQQYLYATYNKKLVNYKSDEQLLIDFILCDNFLGNIDSIRQKHSVQKRYLNFIKQLERNTLLDRIDKIDLETIYNELPFKDEYATTKILVDKINVLKNKESDLSKIVRDFDETRKEILELFNNINEKEKELPENECPLCGYDWPDGYDQLISKIEEKGKKVALLKSNTSKEIADSYNELYENHIKRVVVYLNDYIKEPENFIKEEFYKQIDIDPQKQKKVEEFSKWLEKYSIDTNEIKAKAFNEEILDIDNRAEKLSVLLQSSVKPLEESYDHSSFNSIFKEVFDSSMDDVSKLTVDQLKSKIKYIDQEYFKGNQERKERLEKEIRFISLQQISKFNEVSERLAIIFEAYQQEIRKHRELVAKRIELPFFIFSSKILQNFEKGAGIFIRFGQSSGTENLKFTQGTDTSHDVLHSMSSGQLSALVISFTLAMNKVFDKSNFGVLLIDDPMQSMDEINMASLVELLRNEFVNKQIILSTHEDDVSSFMRFKFHNYSKKTLSINMKNLQYQLSQ